MPTTRAATESVARKGRRVHQLARFASGVRCCAPDFLIVGAQKGGTTSLYAYLAQHPHVIPAVRKEVHFFEDPAARARGERWYRSFFPARAYVRAQEALRGGPVLTGEATPYMACRRAPELLHDVNPDARLIFLLRNPVERAFSHYMHVCRTYPGAEPYSFSEAIRIEPERIRDDVVALDRDKDHDDATFRAFSYVARGMYGEQLERWLAVFPRENVLVCESERFFERPDEVVNDVADFLGLPATSSTNVSEPYNVGGYSSRFSAADRDYLTAIYAEDRAKLQALLGGNFGDRWF